jgi:hypothetical protein
MRPSDVIVIYWSISVLHPVIQAMIHELLGIKDGTVVLDSPKVPDQYR